MVNLQRQIKNYARETKQFKNRVLRATLLMAVLLLLLTVRLFNLQIANYKLYANLAANNQLKLLPIEPNRGLIYDRNGVLLAENLPIFSLHIITKHLKNIKTTLANLQTIIEITPDEIKKLNKELQQHHHLEHLPLKTKLKQEEVAAFYVNRYRFPEVVIETQMTRYYPLANEIANVLGYVSRINKNELKNIDTTNYHFNSFIGKVGIEKKYESTLRGKTGYKVVEVNAAGKIVRILNMVLPTPGDNLYLAIDSKLQQVAQDALGKEKGAVVAIDPNNGELLALVSNPSYDPNLFVNGINSSTFDALQTSNDKPMYNRATKSLFPLASTIKPFLALQGLDTGAITPDFKISDPGWFKLENSSYKYRDWAYNGHGVVNVTKAIMVSCDTFFYTMAVKLGIEKMAAILKLFGFGSKTNIDITEESSGIIASPEWKMQHKGKRWYLGDTIISSIGQGFMAATPLQLAHGVAAIAMHGKRFQPHLLLATQQPSGTKIFQNPIPLPAVNLKNPNNWHIIIAAMQLVVTNPMGNAYSRFGAKPAYSVAGKTGGAQLYHHKIVNENPTPASEANTPKHLRNHSLFIAFAPVENPKIAIAVVAENSIIAPKVARKVLDQYLKGGLMISI